MYINLNTKSNNTIVCFVFKWKYNNCYVRKELWLFYALFTCVSSIFTTIPIDEAHVVSNFNHFLNRS